MNMISSKTLIKLVKKWQRLAMLKRKRISFPKTTEEQACSTSARTEKGHFVMYSADERRFRVPVTYLKSGLLVEFLDVAAEQFGMPRDGPIMLPWDANFVEYALSLIQRHAGEELQNALLVSMDRGHCQSSSLLSLEHKSYQAPLCIF